MKNPLQELSFLSDEGSTVAGQPASAGLPRDVTDQRQVGSRKGSTRRFATSLVTQTLVRANGDDCLEFVVHL